jgi:hypothetical protein
VTSAIDLPVNLHVMCLKETWITRGSGFHQGVTIVMYDKGSGAGQVLTYSFDPDYGTLVDPRSINVGTDANIQSCATKSDTDMYLVYQDRMRLFDSAHMTLSSTALPLPLPAEGWYSSVLYSYRWGTGYRYLAVMGSKKGLMYAIAVIDERTSWYYGSWTLSSSLGVGGVRFVHSFLYMH